MAIDSAAKRKAIPGAGRPWMRSQGNDAAAGREWRASTGNVYPVADFGAAPVASTTPALTSGGARITRVFAPLPEKKKKKPDLRVVEPEERKPEPPLEPDIPFDQMREAFRALGAPIEVEEQLPVLVVRLMSAIATQAQKDTSVQSEAVRQDLVREFGEIRDEIKALGEKLDASNQRVDVFRETLIIAQQAQEDELLIALLLMMLE